MLDDEDEDLGGSAPTIVDLPSGTHPHLLLGLGKSGQAYLLDRDFLGGIGGALLDVKVSDRPIISASATLMSQNTTLVFVQARGFGCPADDGLLALKISGKPALTIEQAWCHSLNGRGIPIVTIGSSSEDAIIWILGAGGDNRLHAFAAASGSEIFVSAPLPLLRRYTTILAVGVEHRLYLAAGDRVVSFEF